MLGFMPAGVEADSGRCVASEAAEFRLWYGFQKFPPVTSAISMLYERNRSSTLLLRGIFAGSSDTACARAWNGATEVATIITTANTAERNCARTNLLSIRHLAGQNKREKKSVTFLMFIAKRTLASIFRWLFSMLCLLQLA
jgi:hypothetical protein